MIPFAVLAFLYALFLVVSGAVLLWLGYRQGSGWLFGSLFVIGGAHVALGMFFLLSSIGMGIDYTLVAGCAWLPNVSTSNGTATAYTWYDTCALSSPPSSYESLFVVFTYLMYAEVFIVSVAGFFFGVKQFWRRL